MAINISKKTWKIVGGVSFITSVGFAAMLGVGCEYKVTTTLVENGITTKSTEGVGSSNYLKMYSQKTTMPNGTVHEINKEQIKAYNDLVRGDASYSDFRKATKESKASLTLALPYLTVGSEDYKNAQTLIDSYGKVETAYNLMVAGAVLFTISILVFIVAVVMLILNRKKLY